ncbi:MAG: EF-P lysine aminoacylase GenX [Hyphomonadaceae bacterium]|nr:EF-P lysine aminoacylase GenX [Hyphomonadaceae bacterium]
MTPASPWWDQSRHADRRPFLQARGRIKSALRDWFNTQGFTEIEAGQLQISPGNETHLHGLGTQVLTPDGRSQTRYLHTSPEFSCKKLLAAGETQIYDFARVFRNREAGPLHATEFTMLEWYRARNDWNVVIADTLTILQVAAAAVPTQHFSRKGHHVALNRSPSRLNVCAAFADMAKIDLLATLTPNGDGDTCLLREAALSAGFKISHDDTWSDIFSKILVEKIEPHLGMESPTILCEYPACEAALARRSPTDGRLSERFELYVCGVELANGFGELTDPIEQRARFEADMALKHAIYGHSYPIDEDFLTALAYMPPASGVAMGFDRLVMLATGAMRIDDVIWTPQTVSNQT